MSLRAVVALFQADPSKIHIVCCPGWTRFFRSMSLFPAVPRPEAMFYGLMQLQRKIKVQKFFGGVNRKEKIEEFFAEHPEEKGQIG